MKVGFVQMDCELLNKERNVDKALKLLDGVRANLIVLPELFNSGYNLNKDEVERVAEKIPDGYTTQKLIELSKEKGMCIIGGIAEKAGGKIYNSAVIIKNFVGVYRKIHLFGNEKRIFAPGNLGFRVFDVDGVNIGIMICFDWFFPEAARTLMLKGADIIAHPSNLVLPWAPDAMKTRSIENRVFTITASRIGEERGLRFRGMSQITDEIGNVLYRSGRKEEVIIRDIDPFKARKKNITEMNNLLEDRQRKYYKY